MLHATLMVLSLAAPPSGAAPTPVAELPALDTLERTEDGVPVQRPTATPHRDSSASSDSQPAAAPPRLPPMPLYNPFTGRYERATPNEVAPRCADEPAPVRTLIRPAAL